MPVRLDQQMIVRRREIDRAGAAPAPCPPASAHHHACIWPGSRGARMFSRSGGTWTTTRIGQGEICGQGGQDLRERVDCARRCADHERAEGRPRSCARASGRFFLRARNR